MTPQEIIKGKLKYNPLTNLITCDSELMSLEVYCDDNPTDTDTLGQFITDAINEKIEREKPKKCICNHDNSCNCRIANFCENCNSPLV